jgi:hypothetical protein
VEQVELAFQSWLTVQTDASAITFLQRRKDTHRIGVSDQKKHDRVLNAKAPLEADLDALPDSDLDTHVDFTAQDDEERKQTTGIETSLHQSKFGVRRRATGMSLGCVAILLHTDSAPRTAPAAGKERKENGRWLRARCDSRLKIASSGRTSA